MASFKRTSKQASLHSFFGGNKIDRDVKSVLNDLLLAVEKNTKSKKKNVYDYSMTTDKMTQWKKDFSSGTQKAER